LLDVAATCALVGSGDDQLLGVIRDSFADELTRDDEYFRDAIENGAPRVYEALRAVVHGGPFSDNQEHAFQYGYAYERLCRLTGTTAPNESFTPHRGDWLSQVDQGLAALRITAVSVESFGYADLPSPLPWTDTPGCGEWTPGQIAKALQQFEATVAAGHAPPLDPEVVDAIMQCIDWMRYAEARPGFGVIGFRF
jgi:hypothetical protein